MPDYVWEQSKWEKFVCIGLVIVIVGLSVALLTVFMSWCWNLGSLHFSLTWFILACLFSILIILGMYYGKCEKKYRKSEIEKENDAYLEDTWSQIMQ